MRLHQLSVGQLYSPTRTTWPEAVEYNYREGGHELRLFLPSPTPGEVEGIRGDTAEFGLLAAPEAIVLLCRFGDGPGRGLPWSDAPYQWWLNEPAARTLPNAEPTAQERALLTVLLIDAATGILRVIRALTLSPEFTAALHAAIRRQARSAWEGRAAYDLGLSRL